MTTSTTDLPLILQNAPDTTAFNKLRKRIVRDTRSAIEDFAMLKPRTDGTRPKWLVCLSGGKDSYTLLATLIDLQWRGYLDVDLLACNLDQGQPGFPATVLPKFLENFAIVHRIEYQNTYKIVTDRIPDTKTFCSLCSRLRRGHLYRIAREEGCDAVVLGHHRDDMLETFMLNMFYGGKLSTMPPKLVNDDGDLLLLRPLAYIAERDCEKYARDMDFPIIPCNLCGSQENLQRAAIKSMLDTWEQHNPDRRAIMFRALQNINPSHMLDRNLFDFKDMTIIK